MDRKAHKKLMIEMFGKGREEINEMYNSGMFNDITKGFLILVLENLGYGNKDIAHAVSELKNCHDTYTAGEARKKVV